MPSLTRESKLTCRPTTNVKINNFTWRLYVNICLYFAWKISLYSVYCILKFKICCCFFIWRLGPFFLKHGKKNFDLKTDHFENLLCIKKLLVYFYVVWPFFIRINNHYHKALCKIFTAKITCRKKCPHLQKKKNQHTMAIFFFLINELSKTDVIFPATVVYRKKHTHMNPWISKITFFCQVAKKPH